MPGDRMAGCGAGTRRPAERRWPGVKELLALDRCPWRPQSPAAHEPPPMASLLARIATTARERWMRKRKIHRSARTAVHIDQGGARLDQGGAHQGGGRPGSGYSARGNLTPGSQPHESQCDLALQIVVDEADRAGASCCRARPRGPSRRRCRRGVLRHAGACHVHPRRVDAGPALPDRIAASGVVVSVTTDSISIGHALSSAVAQRMAAAILASHGRMFRAGATMVPGTDAGVSPG